MPKTEIRKTTTKENLPVFHRQAAITGLVRMDGEEDDAEPSRVFEAAFSSETPVARFFGDEILSHEPGAVRLDWIQGGSAPFLVDHDDRDQVGVIETASIGDDLVGRVRVRLGRSARAEEIRQDIADGIRKNISVGYRIHKLVETDLPGGGSEFRAIDWEPLEVSLVSVPADQSVGIGRGGDLDNHQAEITRIERAAEQPERVEIMNENETAAAEKRKAELEAERLAAVNAATEKRVADVNEIFAIADEFDCADLARKAVQQNTPLDAFRKQVIDLFGERQKNVESSAVLGLNGREQRQYSLLRAIRLAGEQKPIDGFERECSDEIAKRTERDPRGFFVPMDIGWPTRGRGGVEQFQRDLTVGSATAGGNLVGTDHLGGEYIEALRDRMVLASMGIRILENLRGDVTIPAANATTAFEFVAENDAPTEGAPTFRQVSLTPKTISGFVDMSRKLTLQSDPSIEALIRMDLINGAARKIQSAAIVDGATNEPEGVLGQSGIGSVTHGTNGGAPTWGTTVDLFKEVAIDNADDGALSFLTNAPVLAKLMQTPRQSSGVEGQFIVMNRNDGLHGFPMRITNAVPADGTKGSGTALSAMIFGDFSSLLLAFWSGLDLLVDPYSQSSKAILRLTAFQDFDVAVRHAQSFSAAEDLVTT